MTVTLRSDGGRAPGELSCSFSAFSWTSLRFPPDSVTTFAGPSFCVRISRIVQVAAKPASSAGRARSRFAGAGGAE